MTCIVGLVENGVVYIGGDSAGTDGWLSQTIRADSKVFRNGDFLFGFSGSFRMGQLLRFSFKAPYHRPEVETYEYMCTSFVDEVRKTLRDGGFARNESGEERGGFFLVGYRGRLFKIEWDYQVGESVDGYASVGIGADLALGALFVTSGTEPTQRITKALEASAYHNAGVRAPFVVLSV